MPHRAKKRCYSRARALVTGHVQVTTETTKKQAITRGMPVGSSDSSRRAARKNPAVCASSLRFSHAVNVGKPNILFERVECITRPLARQPKAGPKPQPAQRVALPDHFS